MVKRMILMLVLVGLVLAAIFGFEAFRTVMIKKYLAANGAPPQTVSAMKAPIEPWQSQVEAVGSLRAVNGASLSTQVAGIVSAIHFDSGKDVQKSDLLLELNDADDIAKLNSLKAIASLAQITYQRDAAQFRAQAVSKQQVDIDELTLKSDIAQVAQQQATVDFKTLRAPFAGHLGIRQVDIGQYLSAGTAVVTLQQLDPIYCDFILPQQVLQQVKVGDVVTAKIDSFPKESFPGTILAISPLVDVNTRTIQLRASFKNPNHRLLPGMFATIDITVGQPKNYVTLPQTAIAFNPYGSTVFLLVPPNQNPQADKTSQGETSAPSQASTPSQASAAETKPGAANKPAAPKLVARQSFVTTGQTRGDQIAVLTGVKEGDMVVTAGQMKLHNGTPVIVNNSVQPANNPNPTVPNE